MEGLRLRSPVDVGLLGLVTHAARKAAGDEGTPVGLLELELDRGAVVGAERVAVEAAFAHSAGRRVVERLGVRIHVGRASAPDRELITEVLRDFGGTAFTNVCLSHPREDPERAASPYRVADAGNGLGEVEVIDLTVCFPSRFPWLARNDMLSPDAGSASDRRARLALFDALGVAHHGDAVSHRQLRSRMTVEQQTDALMVSAAGGLRAAIYAATLPPQHSARIESAPGELDCCLIRGLYTFGAERSSTAIDAVALEDLLRRRFDFDFADKPWQLLNVHADRPRLGRGALQRINRRR